MVTGHRPLLRHAAVVVAAVYISLAVVTEGEMEDVTLVSQMEDYIQETETERNIPAEGEDDAFNEIQGFSLRAGATVLKGKTLAACENVCLQEAECRSFSYRLKSEECIWSTASLVFDPDFMFAAKTTDPTAQSKYRQFSGMSYRTQGWTIVGGLLRGECEAMCSGTTSCKAYSYRARDKLCLLGPKGIAYSMDFNYFEKKGIPYEPFPLLPPGGSYSCTGSLCPPKKEEAEEAPAATEDPKLKTMEGSVKITESKADAEMAKAKALVAQNSATLKRDKLKEHAELAELKNKDYDVLSEEEKTLIDADNERLAKMEEELKMDAANSEIEDKAKANGKSLEEFKEHSTKQAWTTEQRANAAKERELKQGAKATELMMQNMAANDEEFKAIHEMMKAKDADADAALEEVRKNAEDSFIDEKEEKKVMKEKKELKAKMAGARAANEVLSKLDDTKVQGIEKANDETMTKRSVEANQKDALSGQERARKMAEATKLKERQTKQERATIQKEMAAMEKKIKEGGTEVNEVDAKKYVTLSLAHAKADQAAQEMSAKTANATEYQQKVTLRAKNHAEKLQKLNEAELLKVKEKADKKVATVQYAEQSNAAGSSEVAQKAASNSTEAASKKEAVDAVQSEAQREALLKTDEENAHLAQQEDEKLEADGNAKMRKEAEDTARAEAAAADRSQAEVTAAAKKKEEEEAAADAEAKEMTVKADQNAYKAVRELKTKSMESQGMIERKITADVAAFVDSGEGEVGVDLETAKSNQVVTQNRAADTVTAMQNAKTEVENAKAALKAAEDEHVSVVTPTVAAPADTAITSELGTAELLLDISMGESTGLHHNRHSSGKLDDSWTAPSFGNTDMQLLFKDALGDGQDPDVNKTQAEIQFEKAQADQKVRDDAIEAQKQAQDTAMNTPGTPQERANKIQISATLNAADEQQAKAVAKANVDKAEKSLDDAELQMEAAKNAANEAKASVKAMMNAPSNTAFGEEADMEGELRILGADDWTMNTYMKFPLSTLKDTDTVVEGNLKLFKFGGGNGPIKVHIASCGWSRRDITYTMSEVDPGGFQLVQADVGDDTSELPEAEKQWFDIKLRGDTIQSARLEGTHVCMKISGGPADSFAVISSELTDKKPELVLYAKEGPLPDDGTKREDLLNEEDHKKIKARGVYRLSQKKTITAEETKAAKKSIVDAQNAPQGAHTLAVQEQTTLEQDPYAGLSQTALEAEREAAIVSDLDNRMVPIVSQLKSNQRDAIKAQLIAAGETQGTDSYTSEFDDKMNEWETLTLPALQTQERTTLETDVVRPAEEQKMQDKISAVRVPKEQEMNNKIKDMRCKTMEDCTLTADEQAAVTAKVEARMVTLMATYDAEHNTAEVKAYDVMTAAQHAEEMAKEAAKAKTAADVSANPASDVNADGNSTQVLLQLMEARDRDPDTLYKYMFEPEPSSSMPSAIAWNDVYSRGSVGAGNADVTMMDNGLQDTTLTVDDVMGIH